MTQFERSIEPIILLEHYIVEKPGIQWNCMSV